MSTETTNEPVGLKSITTWEQCAKLQGVDPEQLPDVSMIPERLRKFTIGMYKRAIIVEALNKVEGAEGEKSWKPDYTNWDQNKYYPWVEPGKDSKVPSGFGFSNTNYAYSVTCTNVGSRLVSRNSDIVFHMLEHFREILVDTMTIPPDEE